MARGPRVDVGGQVYHLLNRGNARMTIFEDDQDYAAFERVLKEGLQREPGVALLAYCLMPNHWHLVSRTTRDGELGSFMKWVTGTHTVRWHTHRGKLSAGHVYQGRYKSFLVDTEAYLVALCRYVERNPLRAGLVEQAEAWRWSSLWRWLQPTVSSDAPSLSSWQLPGGGRDGRPRDWKRRVNRPETGPELEMVRHSIRRGCPLGSPEWQERMAAKFCLERTLCPLGRPARTKGV